MMRNRGRTGDTSTRSASPSAALETRTSEPLSAVAPSYTGVESAPQVRNPERYQVINEHGRGGLGRVLRAHDRELGRDVAIKELISRGDIGEVRFLREALITARLEHPGIVPVHEAGRWPDGTPFYAMKLVAGRSLRVLIAERPTVEQRIELLPHVIAVADALAYAHGRNIIHRDLKPANVIVGDFGETVVIDWGLAKDLSVSEASAPGGGPFRSSPDPELTVTGSVLGTPAYMAPEQERGEHVDQRADVYAIGAMLWELCGPRKTPPSEARARHRELRRAGIDRDLISILYKALDPDPVGRYPDAGALAEDLKAFTAGARIGARSYSLFAVLAHWARKHRALSLSALLAAAVAIAVGALFVRGIATERDRADRKAAEATAHQRAAERAKDDLILQHAELLLVSDPTAAHQLLASYRGEDPARADLLQARAVALGVARFRVTASPGLSAFLHVLADGSLVTGGADTITKISPTGASHDIAHGLVRQGTTAFSGARSLLAYACDPAAVCLVQADRARALPAISLGTLPNDLAFSPSGRLLAAISGNGAVTVWTLPDDGAPALRQRAQLANGIVVRFIDENNLLAGAQDHLEVLQLGEPGTAPRSMQRVAVHDPIAIDSRDGELAVATAHGELVMTDGGAWRPALALCKGGLNAIAYVPGRAAIAYACQDGRTGTLDVHTQEPALTFQVAGGCFTVAASADGNTLAFGENGGAVQIYDYRTALVRRVLGHGGHRVTALVATAGGVVSGDNVGTIAAWSAPSTAIQMVFEPSERAILTMMLPANGALITTGGRSVSWLLNSVHGQLEGHDPLRSYMASSKTYPDFILYGSDDAVELWHFGATPTRRVVHTDHGAVTALRYLPGTLDFITAGSDGRLVEWRGDTQREIAAIGESIKIFAVLPGVDNLVLLGASGQLWRVAGGHATRVSEARDVTAVRTSTSGRWIALSTKAGALKLYDSTTWQPVALALPAGVLGLAFSNDDREIAMYTGTAIERRVLGDGPALDRIGAGLAVAARGVAYAPDGNWLAASGGDGTVWLWSRATASWAAYAVSATALAPGAFTIDSKYYVVSDASHVFRVDMAALERERSFSPTTGSSR